MTIKQKFITQPRRADYRIPDLITAEMQLKKRNLISEDQRRPDETSFNIPTEKFASNSLYCVFHNITKYFLARRVLENQNFSITNLFLTS